MKYQKLATFLTFIAPVFIAGAQTPADIQKKYPGEQAVVLNASENYKISMQGGKPHVESEENTQILYFSGGSNLSRYHFYHSAFHEVKNYSAFTQTPDRKKLRVSDYKTFNSTSSGVFYDDVKKTSFDFPGISEGAVANLDVSFVHKNPYLLSPYYFKRGIPVIKNKLVISCPNNISLKYMLRGNDTSEIKCSKITKRGETTYTFEVNDVAGEQSYSDAPESPYYSTHVVFYIDNYIDESGNKVEYLSKVDDLYSFNYSFIKEVEKTPDANVRAIVAELTANAKNAEDKARSIYRWVQQNIKYVAFEDGMGGFVPRNGNMICSRKYGDCKDMSSVLVLMLNTAEVPAYFVWIGTRSLPYNYSELPVPVVDNHMIAAIKKDNGDFIFLDGTDSHCIFGVPPHSIQGKEALVSISETEYKVVKVPVIPKEKNRMTDSTFIRLAGKGVKGDIRLDLEGYFATDARSEMQYVSEKDNEKYMRSLMMRGSNKFLLEKYGSVNTADIAHLAISGSFSLDDYARKIGSEWYINMNLMKLYEHGEIDYPKRKMPVEFDYHFIKKYVTVLEIPEGFKVTYLPENKSYSNNVWGFSMKYTQSGNKLFLTQEFYNDHLLLQPGDFEAWNDVLKNLFPLYKETVTLSEK